MLVKFGFDEISKAFASIGYNNDILEKICILDLSYTNITTKFVKKIH